MQYYIRIMNTYNGESRSMLNWDTIWTDWLSSDVIVIIYLLRSCHLAATGSLARMIEIESRLPLTRYLKRGS